jgi:hypothetical protein
MSIVYLSTTIEHPHPNRTNSCTMRSATLLFAALLGIPLLAGGCTTTDPRDMPLTEVNALDSATRNKAFSTLSDIDRERLVQAAKAYGMDSNALNRRTINQLIDEGKALERNKPMYSK